MGRVKISPHHIYSRSTPPGSDAGLKFRSLNPIERESLPRGAMLIFTGYHTDDAGAALGIVSAASARLTKNDVLVAVNGASSTRAVGGRDATAYTGKKVLSEVQAMVLGTPRLVARL